MQEVNVGEATNQLPNLIDAAVRGEVILITTDDRQIVQLVPVKHSKQPRRAGSAKGMIHMADDLDAPLEDFQDYAENMPIIGGDTVIEVYGVNRLW